MADLDPLKFAVAIQDEATQKLNDIESKLNSLKDQQITVTVHGIEDLRSLLQVLQHQMVNNLGNNVSQGVSDALRSMQTEAQAAIRQSLSDLSANLATIKEAIQHDNFTAFGNRIGKCADEVNRLNEAFEKFHITIGKDDGLKNFMTGLGEVIRNIRQTMGQLHGNDPGYNVTPDALSRSINVAKHETERLNTRLTETQRTIETFSDKGFNTARLERYKTLLIDVRDNLAMIEKNGGVHPITGLTASQYMSSEDASRVVSLLNTELSYYKGIGNELERIAKLKGEINSLLSTPSISTATKKDLSYTLSGLDLREGLLGRLGVRDAMQSLNTDGYRQQIAEAISLIQKSKEETRQSAQSARQSEKENDRWAESMRRAGVEATNLKIKIDALEGIKERGRLAGVDVRALETRINELRNMLTILQSMEAGMRIHGTAGDYVRSVPYQTSLKLADVESGAVQSNTDKKEKNALATAKLNDVERQLAQSLKKTTNEMRGQSQMLSDLKMLATQYLGVWGAQGFLNNIIKIGGQLESQRLSLTAILGQRSYANDLFEKVQDLALKSPFGVVQLDQYSKNLSAFGFQYHELFDMTKRLADIAAGTGTDFGRLALALGHVRSEMALTGYTLRQFSMANVPMLKMLAENLGVTTAEIRKMVREKKVSYEDVEKVLKDLTDEGGMFYNMQEVMSEAVSAKFKNLKDAMDIMYGQMAESVLGDMLKGIAATLTEITKRWQTFGTVLLNTALIIGAYKMYMHLLNVGIRTNTINLLQNVAATKTLTAADVEQMLEKKLLTAQDIALALAEGRLTLEQAKGALIAAGYTEAIIAEIAATNGLSAAMTGLKASSAGMVAMLTNPWTAALLAVEAVIGAVMAYKSWSDGIYGDVETALERSKTAAQEIGKYLKEASESKKPTDEKDLSTEIEQMKTILKNSELYTEELDNQVKLAPSLSDEYDVLISKMRAANDELAESGSKTEAIAEAIKHTSGEFWSFSIPENLRFFFNDDIGKNLGQLEKSRGSFVSLMDGALSQYRDEMQKVVDAIATQEHVVFDNGKQQVEYITDADMRAKLLNKTLEEQLRILSSKGNLRYWEMFVRGMKMSNEGFGEYADDMKDRLDDMNGDFREILEDDIPRLLEALWTDKGFKSKEEFRKWAEENTDSFNQMLTDIERVLAQKAPHIAGMLRGMMIGWLEGNNDWTLFEIPQMFSPEEQEKMRQNMLRKGFGKIGEKTQDTLNTFAKGLGKGENFFDNAFIANYFKGGSDASEGIDEMGKRWKKLKSQIEANKKVGYATPQEILDEKERLDVADKFWGFDKKKGGKSGSKEDKEAKELRERVRILKEAADSYKYWREKVGDEGAETHVESEFGKLLSEQGFKFENIEKFRKTLSSLREEYEKKPQSKAMLEALKELDKEVAKLDRSDFEKGSEEFLSRMKAQLDGLTRSWEIFNSVREATGDESLASQLSGKQDIDNFRNLADLVKANMIEDFKVLGVKKWLAFDVNLSDNEIEQEVFAAVPRQTEESVEAYERRIQGLIEEYKKWRDLQRSAIKEDVINFAKLIGSVVSYESEVKKIDADLSRTIDANNSLVGKTDENSGAIVTQEMADRGNEIARVTADTKKLELSSAYINLMNNSLSMTKSEVIAAAKTIEENLNDRLRVGTITAKEYADEMKKLSEITQKFDENSLFGKNTAFTAFMNGGLKGSQSFVSGRIQALDTRKNSEGLSEKESKELERLTNLKKDIDAAITGLNGFSTVLQIVTGTLDGFQKAAKSLSEMFQALGHSNSANTWSDIADGISAVSSVLDPATNLIQNAQNGNIGGVVSSAISAPIDMISGPITGFAKLHDKKLERHISDLRKDIQGIDNTLNLIRSLREKTLGYDYGEKRRSLANLYAPSSEIAHKYSSIFGTPSYLRKGFRSVEDEMMYDYYTRNGLGGTGYEQEYRSLQLEREKYIGILSDLRDEKDASDSEIEETEAKIAELDQQIATFTEDLAKELWGIDVKSWADQLSDALCSAFENGESAAKAYKDTVRSILQNVMNKMMQMQILEPMFKNLEDKLFGKNGTFDINNLKGSSSAVISTLTDFFGKGGEGEEAITAALEFMNAFERGLNNAGLTVKNDNTANTLSSSIQGTSEETSDLLAAYLNACRQDVAINRILLTQFVSEIWPSYIEQVTGAVKSLSSIDQNVSFIRALLSENGALYNMLSSMKSHLDNITNGNEQISVK